MYADKYRTCVFVRDGGAVFEVVHLALLLDVVRDEHIVVTSRHAAVDSGEPAQSVQLIRDCQIDVLFEQTVTALRAAVYAAVTRVDNDGHVWRIRTRRGSALTPTEKMRGQPEQRASRDKQYSDRDKPERRMMPAVFWYFTCSHDLLMYTPFFCI